MSATRRETEGGPGRAGWRRRVGIGVAAAVGGAAYWTVARPRLLNLGATPEETRRPLPGDALLAEPYSESTMAATIAARPQDVWPWLVQLGQGRGGFYSYEWAENLFGLDIHNADHVITAFQDLAVGDEVRLGTPARYPDAYLEVATIEPERALVLEQPGDPTGWVWAFVLEPAGPEETRLLVRSRIGPPATRLGTAATTLFIEPAAVVMTWGMLRGLRERAERLAARRIEHRAEP